MTGDTNLNGVVDFEDFLSLSTNFGTNNRDWAHGNFNGDAEVNFADFLALSANFGTTLTRSEAAAVPEPSSSGLVAAGIVALLIRRKRRKARVPSSKSDGSLGRSGTLRMLSLLG